MTKPTFSWKDQHQKTYKNVDWIDKPSIFAQEAIDYFPKTGRILELGAGQGQDSRFFAERGYKIVSTDAEEAALELSRSKIPAKFQSAIKTQKLDLTQPFPFKNETFDIVYAHLSLHYFTHAVTQQIFQEIHRVLKPGGTLAFFTNSTSDPEFGTGPQLEPNYFEIDGLAKRYFDVEMATRYAAAFSVTLADNNGETYKDTAKGIHNLIRFIGTKAS